MIVLSELNYVLSCAKQLFSKCLGKPAPEVHINECRVS